VRFERYSPIINLPLRFPVIFTEQMTARGCLCRTEYISADQRRRWPHQVVSEPKKKLKRNGP